MNLKKLKVLAIIPARKGSKGIPNKNFKIIKNNKRLIDYTIIEAKKSNYISKIALTSDDERIINHTKKYKLDFIIKRPKKYSTDQSKTISVVLDVLKKVKKFQADLILLLQPTSPLRKSSQIDKAIKTLLKNDKNYHSLVSVVKLEDPHPYKLKKIKDNYLVPFLKNKSSEVPRQSLEKVFKLNGSIYLIKTEIFREYKSFFIKTYPFVMNEKYSLNLDTMNDLKVLQSSNLL